MSTSGVAVRSPAARASTERCTSRTAPTICRTTTSARSRPTPTLTPRIAQSRASPTTPARRRRRPAAGRPSAARSAVVDVVDDGLLGRRHRARRDRAGGAMLPASSAGTILWSLRARYVVIAVRIVAKRTACSVMPCVRVQLRVELGPAGGQLGLEGRPGRGVGEEVGGVALPDALVGLLDRVQVGERHDVVVVEVLLGRGQDADPSDGHDAQQDADRRAERDHRQDLDADRPVGEPAGAACGRREGRGRGHDANS